MSSCHILWLTPALADSCVHHACMRLQVKPPVGLSTPKIFKSLDLDRRSTADPRALLSGMAQGSITPSLCVNDLEQPAFDK